MMRTRVAIRPIRLNTDEVFDIRDGEGCTVACLDGSAWITQSDDLRDIVLNAGKSFVLDRPGLAVVCAAAGPATMAIEVSPLPPLPPYRWDMRNAARSPSISAGV